VAQLRAAGFALRGVDLERLARSAGDPRSGSLARALLHGADRSAWLALLRAPWCGLTWASSSLLAGCELAICSHGTELSACRHAG
jgi:ATP-dependent helicase/nuclease subunit A